MRLARSIQETGSVCSGDSSHRIFPLPALCTSRAWLAEVADLAHLADLAHVTRRPLLLWRSVHGLHT